MFDFVSATSDQVVLRALRNCSGQEFLASLPVSKATRKRFATRDVPSAITAGQEVTLVLEESRVPAPMSDKPADVLWFDRFALVANKPTGLLVHGDGTLAPTLTERVQGGLAQVAAKRDWLFVPVAQAVNRLDVDTSGLVLFSLTTEFQPAFDMLVADHGPRMHKRYLAIVEGSFPPGLHTIDAPIARDRHDARRMRVGKTGKRSQTRVMCLQRSGGYSLVACELLTGRRHQIRVHLAYAGHPIVGDALYGRTAHFAKPGSSAAQLMLHAYQLDFLHPLTGRRIVLTTEWPGRFASLFTRRTVDWTILESKLAAGHKAGRQPNGKT